MSDLPAVRRAVAASAVAILAMAEFERLSTADPAVVFQAMRSAAEKLATTAPQITNDEVAALVPPLQDMFAQTADVMEAITEGDATRSGELAELGKKFSERSQAFQ